MRLSETTYDNSETGCCAPLDVARWDEQEVTWNKKAFLRDHIREFMHLPLNFGSVITRDNSAIEESAAYPREPLWLVDEVSPWGSHIYVAVEGDVPGATIESLTGRFLTKVFEGPYRHVGKWTREMTEYTESQGESMTKIFYHYATCPKCAKHFGANRVVLFAQLA